LLDEGLGIKLPLGTEFDLDDLLRMDGVAMAEMVKTLVGAGVMKIDEARKKFALPPTEGGDTPYLQEQNFSLAAMAKRDAKPDPWAKAGDARPATPAPAAPDETERAIAAVRFKFAEALHVA
jgi:phage portal protein BeeE